MAENPNNVVVYCNTQSFYTALTPPESAQFDTLIIAFAYPPGVPLHTDPVPGTDYDYFGYPAHLIDWNGGTPGNQMTVATQTWLQVFTGDVFLSVGGAGGDTVKPATVRAMYEAWGGDVPTFTTMLALWVDTFFNDYGIEIRGIDFDYEYFVFGEDWTSAKNRCDLLIALTNAAATVDTRAGSGRKLKVSHAPQIPYVVSYATDSSSASYIGAYVYIINETRHKLTFLNVQCYNNSAFTTPTYWVESAWEHMTDGSATWAWPGSLSAPVPGSMLRLGLPLEPTDADSGYVAPTALFSTRELYGRLNGTGLMFWQLSGTDPVARWGELAAFVECLAPWTLVATEPCGKLVRIDQLPAQALVRGMGADGVCVPVEVTVVRQQLHQRASVWVDRHKTVGFSDAHCVVVPASPDTRLCECVDCAPIHIAGYRTVLARHAAVGSGTPSPLAHTVSGPRPTWWHLVSTHADGALAVFGAAGWAFELFRTPLEQVLARGWSRVGA
jgi:hypothetical protein